MSSFATGFWSGDYAGGTYPRPRNLALTLTMRRDVLMKNYRLGCALWEAPTGRARESAGAYDSANASGCRGDVWESVG